MLQRWKRDIFQKCMSYRHSCVLVQPNGTVKDMQYWKMLHFFGKLQSGQMLWNEELDCMYFLPFNLNKTPLSMLYWCHQYNIERGEGDLVHICVGQVMTQANILTATTAL
jgi:hypothetical protein